jgi:hypothetical protein
VKRWGNVVFRAGDVVERAAEADDPFAHGKTMRGIVRGRSANGELLVDWDDYPRHHRPTAVSEVGLYKILERAHTDVAGARQGYAAIAGLTPILGSLARAASGDAVREAQHAALPQARDPLALPAPVEIPPEPTRQNLGGLVPDLPRTGAPKSASLDQRRLGSGQKRMLLVLAEHPSQALSRGELRARSGHPKGTFATYVSTLRSCGMVVTSGESIEMTSVGLAFIEASLKHAPTSLEVYVKKLAVRPRAMVEILARSFRRRLPLRELAGRAGYDASSSTFRKDIGDLIVAGAVEEHRGLVRASQSLCPSRSIES